MTVAKVLRKDGLLFGQGLGLRLENTEAVSEFWNSQWLEALCNDVESVCLLRDCKKLNHFEHVWIQMLLRGGEAAAREVKMI